MSKQSRKFKVRYKYSGSVTVEVEADDEKHAETLGLAEADERIGMNISVDETSIWEIGV